VFADKKVDGCAGAHKPVPSLKHILELLMGNPEPAQVEYIATSTSRLSDAVILNKTHWMVEFVINENHVTGVVPLSLQKTLGPVVEDVV